MQLHERPPKLRLFGFKSALIKIHTDLLHIHKYVQAWTAYFPNELTLLEEMVIALEDRRFFRHAGIDSISVMRELLRAFTFRRHGGASTIDMQFVRTATGYKSKTFRRKIYKALLAVIIQYRYSKIVILRSYLRCAFFGSHLTGADRAANAVFAVSADHLNSDQAAFIAAMLVYPRPLVPPAGWQLRVCKRANYGMTVYVAQKKSLYQFCG